MMPSRARAEVRWRAVPGLMAAAVIALVATGADVLITVPVSPVLLAVLLGLVISNAGGVREHIAPLAAGASFAARRILRLGIILLGAQLSLGDFAHVGVRAALLVIACMSLAFTLVFVFGAALGVRGAARALIAVGTAVCGNTAIMATAPIIEAKEREVSYAVGTITLLGTIGLLLFPAVGSLLGLGDVAFGLWAGLAINDTSQVVAAGAAYSDGARDIATVVKLFRNALMAPILLAISVVAARRATAQPGGIGAGVRKSFPMFIFGFLALTAARSLGWLPRWFVEISGATASMCIVVAIAGVGLTTRLSSVREVGLRPLFVGAMATVSLAAVAFWLATTIGET